ncbi:metalloregulator ArsR/SmtB family transcription factor [Asanoa sp. WMMD1127]|uniref:ArsR/SmtB family transcription factor n=1 Tax=Asanoa sp. WMMD1127 TaxID=3016107 RepID=UPI0024174BD3|nr:metalloregulator ArsR/SmtB family transcription factor [Asanoa sp. WMMD1127]MDG4824007.1 metalloregulator ArsR/SmtB family transcription factor [Asanoa sp. WMMD1127]
MDLVFKALADPSRRQLLDSLNARNGQSLRELCAGLDMARQSVSKHLAVLEAAELVTTVRRGREKLHYLNAAPVNAIADRWINRYDRGRAQALADLKTTLERSGMSTSEFVYTTYINTTPEKLWQALTDPAFTKRYWGTEFETDWAADSTMVWLADGARIADPEQVILESDPPRRLTYTWHTFTTDWAKASGIAEEDRARFAAEPRSTVTFELEPAGTAVKLTVIHGGFPGPDSAVLNAITTGWPQIISSLKTLLETDEVPTW